MPERYFRRIDGRLGDYRKLADAADAVLMLASDHGFTWKDDRPQTLSSNATTTAAKWHRKEGIYLLWGAGMPRLQGQRPRDREPGLRHAPGAARPAAGPDIEDPPLTGVVGAGELAVDYTAFYHAGRRARRRPGSKANADALAKLKSLGYIADSGRRAGRSAGTTRTPGSFNNEGVILKEAGHDRRGDRRRSRKRSPPIRTSRRRSGI